MSTTITGKPKNYIRVSAWRTLTYSKPDEVSSESAPNQDMHPTWLNQTQPGTNQTNACNIKTVYDINVIFMWNK